MMMSEEELEKKKYERMTSGNIKKLVSLLAVPTIISMLITNLYNMADSFFVGQLKDSSQTGAISVVLSLMSIIQAIGFFFGHGSGNFMSRELGKKNHENASKMAATGLVIAFLFGLVLAILGLFLLKPFARILGSTETILPYAMDYMKYILIATPFMTSSFVLNNQLRFQGSARNAMIGIASGAILNIILDALLIQRMGISGAGLATAISQILSFFILFSMTFIKGNIRIQLKKVQWKWHYLWEIFRGGFPSVCRQGIASIASICLTIAAKKYAGDFDPDDVISAVGIVARIMNFGNAIIIGFNQGYQPVCAYNYGAGKKRRVREAFWFTLWVGEAMGVILGTLFILFSPQLIQLFADMEKQKAVIDLGAKALRIQATVFPLIVFINISNMSMQAMAKVVRASLLAAARQWLCFIPLLFLLPIFWGLDGILYAQAIADGFTFLISLPFTYFLLRELKQDVPHNVEYEK